MRGQRRKGDMKTLKKKRPLMKGEKVTQFQQLVRAAGFDCGAVDGKYGDGCVAACKAFQKARGLVVDGICGEKTWKALLATAKEPQSGHFTLSEFKCHNGTSVPPDYWPNLQSLMENKLEPLRHACGDKPMTIVSGYRTPAYNKKVGGAANSQHLTATGADVRVQGLPPAQVHAIANKLFSTGGVGQYPNFTHVDNRPSRARW